MVVNYQEHTASQDPCIGIVIDCYFQEEIDDITVFSDFPIEEINDNERKALGDDIKLWINDEFEWERNTPGDVKHRIDLGDNMIWVSNCSDESSQISSIESRSFLLRGDYEKKGNNVTDASMIPAGNVQECLRDNVLYDQVHPTYEKENMIPSHSAGDPKNKTPCSSCMKSRSIMSGTFQEEANLKCSEAQFFSVSRNKMVLNRSLNGAAVSMRLRRPIRLSNLGRRREVHPSVFRRVKH